MKVKDRNTNSVTDFHLRVPKVTSLKDVLFLKAHLHLPVMHFPEIILAAVSKVSFWKIQ